MRFLLLTFVFCVLSGSGVHAQSPTQNYIMANPTFLIKRQYKNWLEYKRLAAKARHYDKRNEFPFEKMVYAYARGNGYDPYGIETIDMLNKLAFEIENTEAPEALEEKYQQFNNIVNDHLGNLGIVNAAISLTRQNKALGDIEFFQWIKSGLIKRLLKSGKGYNPASAYKIVSMEEENFLLMQKNLELIDREFFSTGSQFYHVYRTQQRETGNLIKFYTDLGNVMSREIVNKTIENPYYRYTPKVPDDF